MSLHKCPLYTVKNSTNRVKKNIKIQPADKTHKKTSPPNLSHTGSRAVRSDQQVFSLWADGASSGGIS